MSILIKNALLNSKKTNIYIEENKISEIGKVRKAEFVIDANKKAVLPSFVNTHTHLAMTLFRGYADDMELHEWLTKKIWPLEGKLTANDVYWGAKLGCLELIKSGTTAFNDMYWFEEGCAKAVNEMGIRGYLSAAFIGLNKSEDDCKKEVVNSLKKLKEFKNERIVSCLGPHALYTVNKEQLQFISELAKEENLLIHFHLSETKKEVDDCIARYGKHPVEFLKEIGFLSQNLIVAHAVWLNDKEIKILAKHGVKISHCPTSNMKLAIGNALQYQKMKNANLNISLGTDGCASNNNLSMLQSMKFASLLQKFAKNNQMILNANEVYEMATLNAAKALNLNAGEIKVGKLADLILINLKNIELIPSHSLISNLVYAANDACIDTVICNGKILMENRKVKGEMQILEKVNKIAMNLVR